MAPSPWPFLMAGCRRPTLGNGPPESVGVPTPARSSMFRWGRATNCWSVSSRRAVWRLRRLATGRTSGATPRLGRRISGSWAALSSRCDGETSSESQHSLMPPCSFFDHRPFRLRIPERPGSHRPCAQRESRTCRVESFRIWRPKSCVGACLANWAPARRRSPAGLGIGIGTVGPFCLGANRALSDRCAPLRADREDRVSGQTGCRLKFGPSGTDWAVWFRSPMKLRWFGARCSEHGGLWASCARARGCGLQGLGVGQALGLCRLGCNALATGRDGRASPRPISLGSMMTADAARSSPTRLCWPSGRAWPEPNPWTVGGLRLRPFQFSRLPWIVSGPWPRRGRTTLRRRCSDASRRSGSMQFSCHGARDAGLGRLGCPLAEGWSRSWDADGGQEEGRYVRVVRRLCFSYSTQAHPRL